MMLQLYVVELNLKAYSLVPDQWTPYSYFHAFMEGNGLSYSRWILWKSILNTDLNDRYAASLLAEKKLYEIEREMKERPF